MGLADLMTHYAEELRATADILKKCRDLKSFVYYDKDSNPCQIKTIAELKAFLQLEMQAYLDAIEEL